MCYLGCMTTEAILLGEPLPVELMNTIGIGRDGVHDALTTDAEAADWLNAVGDRIAAATGRTLGALREDDVRPAAGRLRDLRDALRLLAAEVTEDPRPSANASPPTRAQAIETLNTLAAAWPQLVWPPDAEPTRTYRAPGDPVDLAIALMAHQGVELFAGAGRERLRACLAPNCLLFFSKDHPRREWCSPGCGNRVRVARHYQRHHATRGAKNRTR